MFVLLLVVSAAGKDDAPQDAAIQQQVQDLAAQVDERGARLAAMERYLADKSLAAKGGAPRGWVQPPIEKYAAAGAPSSFLPGAPVAKALPTPLPIAEPGDAMGAMSLPAP